MKFENRIYDSYVSGVLMAFVKEATFRSEFLKEIFWFLLGTS